ncbi:MAG: hypothetical protein LRY73_08815 [Bacillus sp. (in: Bacteria)]|nr:hypothetical protein [Bacillus sp. (in: firmicutes)]
MLIDGAVVESWYRLLVGEEFRVVMRRLDNHVRQNKVMPTIFDLVEKPRPEHNKNVLRQVAEWEEVANGGPRPRKY